MRTVLALLLLCGVAHAEVHSTAGTPGAPGAPSPAYTLPPATAALLGGVKVGTNLTAAADGTLSAPAPYTDAMARVQAQQAIAASPGYILPAATVSVLGGVKIGANLSAAPDGTLSAPAPYTDAMARVQAQQAIAASPGYILPAATVSVLGGVKIGANLSAAPDGTLSAPAPYTDAMARVQAQQAIAATPGYALPAATANTLGGIKVGANLTAAADGTLSAPAPYTDAMARTQAQQAIAATPGYALPAATANTLGGIKVGTNLTAAADGTLSAPAPYTDTLARVQAQQAITALGLGTAATQPATAFYAASNPSSYITASGAPVQSVAGRTGAVTLAVTDVSGAATALSVSAETTRATAAEGNLVPLAQKGAASGVAPLDSTSRLPAANLTAGVPAYYNSSGLIAGVKCWQGRATTATGGTWAVTFTGVSFAAAPIVSVQAISGGTTLTLQYVAFPTVPTATGVSGTVASGTSLSVLGATLVAAPAGVSVHVTACGA